MKTLNWLMALLLLTASTWSFAEEKVLYEATTYNKPNIREVSERYLGDRLLEQGEGEWKECITPRTTFTKKTFSWVGEYRGGEPICKRKLKDKYYWPLYDNATNGGNATRQAVKWQERKGGKYRMCQTAAGMNAYCVKDLKESDVKEGETFIYQPNSMQQTIEYAGKSGDILKFNYAEFSDGFARQAFNREFTVDLSEGNVAAYKGAIIEIIEATNVQIKYKVIRNFASDR